MATYRFAVQHTGRPFGPAETPYGWREISRHTSLNAARRQVDHLYTEMKSSCGPGAWDDHYRVIALRDTTLQYEWYCTGWIGTDGKTHYCPSYTDTITHASWPAGQPEPVDSAHEPEGWMGSQCPACHEAQDADENAYNQRMQNFEAVATSVAEYDEDGKLVNPSAVKTALENAGMDWADALNYINQL